MMVSGIPDELFPKPGQVVEKSPKSSKKYLIIGYHDKRYDSRLFEDIRDFMKVFVDGCSFALMHYPMLSWPRKSSGGYQLHGHIHARIKQIKDLFQCLKTASGIKANLSKMKILS